MDNNNNALKALSRTDDELRVGNYIVLYGGRDLEGIASDKKNDDGSRGEYFTPDTDLESAYTKTGRLYVDFEHGLGKYLDGDDAPGPDDVLGFVDWKTVRRDERGVWVERVLSRRNEYMQFLEELIEEGLIGNSSEAVPDGVKRASDGAIQVWPLRRDTLTVTPMEPRMLTENAVAALKHLAEVQPHLKALLPQAAASGDEDATVGAEGSITKIKEHKTMTDKIEISLDRYEELVRNQAPQPQGVPDPDNISTREQLEDPKVKAIQDQLNELVDIVKRSPVLKDASYVAPDSETDHPEAKSFGDFLVAVRQNNTKRLKEVYKAALAEGDGTTGGYLVPVEFGGEMEVAINAEVLLRKHGAPVSRMTGRSKEHWVLDVETAPSAGSTAGAGGVVGYWISEAGSITESEPKFRLIELVAHKLAAYSLASSEVRADATETLDGLLARSFVKELAAQENYAHFRGDGVGKPLGILNSSAWGTVTRSAGSAVALADVAKMEANFIPGSRGLWVFDPSAWEKVVGLVSNPLSFLNDLNEAPPTQLLGRPVEVYGGLPNLNTAGDAMLVGLDYYLIGERSGIQIAFSEHFKFQNDQLAWRVTRRIDGQPIINGAITAEDASTTYRAFIGLAAG